MPLGRTSLQPPSSRGRIGSEREGRAASDRRTPEARGKPSIAGLSGAGTDGDALVTREGFGRGSPMDEVQEPDVNRRSRAILSGTGTGGDPLVIGADSEEEWLGAVRFASPGGLLDLVWDPGP